MSLFYKSIDDRKFNTWCSHTKRLDTYGCGCQHDCSYCYAKTLLSFRGLWNSERPSVPDLYKIKKVIKDHPKNEVIKLGGMTDCFQPIELNERVTYKTIKMLNYYKVHYLIVTKSHYVTNEEYMKIYNPNLVHFQITITNTDDIKSSKYEKASAPSKRIKSIEKLQSAGFDVSVRLSPFIYNFIDFTILNSIKCDKILIEFLKVNHWIRKWFDIDYNRYSLKYGGYDHLELGDKINHIKDIKGFSQVSIGESVYDHYRYFADNVNYNKNDCCNLTLNLEPVKKYIQLEMF